MNKGTVSVLVIAVTVLSCTGYSRATILGTIDYSREGSGIGEFSGPNLSICYPLITENGFNTTLLSLGWDVTQDDVGKTFVASADTHEIFNSFVSMLTNGIDDTLLLNDCTLKSIYDRPGEGLESTFISGIGDGVDFDGYTVDSIALTINDLFSYNISTPIEGTFPGIHSFNYVPPLAISTYHLSYDITYTINGTENIPEPATVLLIGLGAVAFRRKCKG
jgi:hypothetical protein